MATKMSQNKQEFFNSIEIRYKDYRKNPEESRRIWESLSPKQRRDSFRVQPHHFKEAFWLMRDFIDLKSIKLEYLDGERQMHITGDVSIKKNGKYYGKIYLSNTFSQNVVVDVKDGVIDFGPRFDPTVKQFFKAVRELRDYVKMKIE